MVGTPNTSIVYHSLNTRNYDLETLEQICTDLLPLYGNVYLLSDFNFDLLDPSGFLYAPFDDILEAFMLYNVSILPSREILGKLLDFANPDEIADFYQMNIPWSDHDMIFLSCRRSLAISRAVERWTRNFWSIEQSELLCAATRLDWLSFRYLPTLNMEVERFYELVQYLLVD
jgi:hypothetical protein